jgi:Ca-activated chloride channel family protein
MKIVALSGLMILGAGTWTGLWFTPDQLGQRLMDAGNFAEAAREFHDPMRQGTAWFRAGEFEKAEQAFARVATPEADYNRGNSLVMLGKYDLAVGRYDQALNQRPGWDQALANRAIAVARAKLVEAKGGEMGDQKIGADDIVFDKKKDSGGQDTEISKEEALSDSSMQALWLRRVQTKPADFLKFKFSYQLTMGSDEETKEESSE